MNYELFRKLFEESRSDNETLERCLIDPGPDIIVCDEGHLLKNDKTSLNEALNSVKTMRRFALTGTPLQNNLEEYFHMVNFVKPHLLGTLKEYRNRFVNPITNGQYQNSQPSDINLMKARSHILHKLLEGCVQRLDSTVLGSMLPKKHEFVIYIRLSELQEELYKVYDMLKVK